MLFIATLSILNIFLCQFIKTKSRGVYAKKFAGNSRTRQSDARATSRQMCVCAGRVLLCAAGGARRASATGDGLARWRCKTDRACAPDRSTDSTVGLRPARAARPRSIPAAFPAPSHIAKSFFRNSILSLNMFIINTHNSVYGLFYRVFLNLSVL